MTDAVPDSTSAKHRSKHPIRDRVAAYSLVLLAALGVLRFASRFIIFPGNAQALPPPGGLVFHGASVVDYATKDGVSLRGVWMRSSKADAITVLYFHGNAESAASVVPIAARLSSIGVNTFVAEYRGYGGRPGSPSEEGLYADGEAALEQVRAAQVTDERLVIVGRSLGSGVAVELARRGNGRALFLFSPATSFTDVAWGSVGPLAPLVVRDPFDSLAKISAVKVPVVVFHGTSDTLIPFELGKRLAEAAPKGRLVPIQGRGHNDLDEDDLLIHELAPLVAK